MNSNHLLHCSGKRNMNHTKKNMTNKKWKQLMLPVMNRHRLIFVFVGTNKRIKNECSQ